MAVTPFKPPQTWWVFPGHISDVQKQTSYVTAFKSYRITTCEYVHLVWLGHFRSRDKDVGHIIQSATAKNPILHANFMALCFTEPELLPIKVLHCGNKIFDLFLLWPWPWPRPNGLHTWTWPVILGDTCKYELPTSRLSKVILWQTDRQSRPKLYTMLLCRWSIILNYIV